ncbi:hypothetical protein BELL_1057g00010 [Botrytis elliptica]|uniref:J domain-containing protein n=1 Tax=Botrytis elliptica TaxID=278938 RepID=A0A4Z1IR43_9HELO|nr:hypothetical protein BELL_1057g00010 [Botrytis elliptica]
MKELRRYQRPLIRALHPDKHSFASPFQQRKAHQAIKLISEAVETLKNEHSKASYTRQCSYIQFRDKRGSMRSTCDVRPMDLMSYSDWMIELLQLQSGDQGWLNRLGKNIYSEHVNWGWGYVYDQDQKPQLKWGGPDLMKLSFIDQCEEIEILIPRRTYRRPESLWKMQKNLLEKRWEEWELKNSDVERGLALMFLLLVVCWVIWLSLKKMSRRNKGDSSRKLEGEEKRTRRGGMTEIGIQGMKNEMSGQQLTQELSVKRLSLEEHSMDDELMDDQSISSEQSM